MKTALTVTVILALIAAIIVQAEYQHPRHLAALRATYLAEIKSLDDNLDSSLAERDHLAEQLDKAQRDLVALAAELKAAQAEAKAKAEFTDPHPINPVPNPINPAPNPIPNPVNPAPNPVNPVPSTAPAELATLRAQLAAAEARQKQVQDFDPGFDEQRIDPKTGRKSGIRTSDADRQKLEAQRTAELQRVGNLILDLRRRIAALESQLPR